MKVHNILQSFQSNILHKKELNNIKKPADASANDVVSISSEARDLQMANSIVQNGETTGAAKIRPEKIELAKQRIADGYYSSPKVLSEIADLLLKQMNI